MRNDPKLESEAAWKFMEQFCNYVRRCDPELWLRARQYAEDCTTVKDVPFMDLYKNHRFPDLPPLDGNLE